MNYKFFFQSNIFNFNFQVNYPVTYSDTYINSWTVYKIKLLANF